MLNSRGESLLSPSYGEELGFFKLEVLCLPKRTFACTDINQSALGWVLTLDVGYTCPLSCDLNAVFFLFWGLGVCLV